MRRCRVVVLTACLATASTCFIAASAHGDPKKDSREKRVKGNARANTNIARRVDTHLRRGIEFYAEKQYELAIVEFRAGFALDPLPDFLFALAQAERLSGDCPTAVVYYRRFLETKPAAEQAEAARVNLRRCSRALESGADGRPPGPTARALDEAEQAAPSPPAVAPKTTRVVSPARARPWYRDRITATLAGSSVVALGIAAGFWTAARTAQSDSQNSANYFDHQSAADRARGYQRIGLVSLVAGAALGAGAIYRLRSPPAESHRSQLSLSPLKSGGATVTFAGSF